MPKELYHLLCVLCVLATSYTVYLYVWLIARHLRYMVLNAVPHSGIVDALTPGWIREVEGSLRVVVEEKGEAKSYGTSS